MDDRDRMRIVLERLLERNETDLELFEKWHAFAREAGMARLSADFGEAKAHLTQVREALKRGLGLMEG